MIKAYSNNTPAMNEKKLKAHPKLTKVQWKTDKTTVGVILKKARIYVKRQWIHKDPALLLKYLVRFYYKSGVVQSFWVRHNMLSVIKEKTFRAFLKEHPPRKAKSPKKGK